MKIEIKQLNITLHHQQPSGLLATLAIAGASAGSIIPKGEAPAVGEKWPGLAATYAGLSLSSTGDQIVHLILWDADTTPALNHADAAKHAESANPELHSHLPTRHQGITLFENLQAHFNKDWWYWLQTKTKGGDAAFVQGFYDGGQDDGGLAYEARVRAVSEIQL